MPCITLSSGKTVCFEDNKYPDGGEVAFKKFVQTLPSNLKDSSNYNLRGYWEALGKPNSFNYNQPKESDGKYHAFSRNPNTGEILKSQNHPTFRMALEEDAKIGYLPYSSPDGKTYTFKKDEVPTGFKPFTGGGLTEYITPKFVDGGKTNNMKNGINNPGFKSLPGFVQQKIVANMAMGGLAIPTEGDKIVKNNAPAAPKQLTSQQLASLATSQFSKDPSMQTPLPNFIGSYQLTDMDKTLMMEAMKQMKGGQGSTGAYPAITPQMIDQIRPKIEQNRTMDQPMEREIGGMNAMPIAEMSITDPDYEQMMLQYGGMIQDLDGAQVIQKFGKGGGITYRGHKFPGYNKPIKTPPGDKYKKMVLVKKGDKVRLVKMGYNTKK